MANNETKVEVMAISLLIPRSSREDMSPSFEKESMAQKKMQLKAASLWGDQNEKTFNWCCNGVRHRFIIS